MIQATFYYFGAVYLYQTVFIADSSLAYYVTDEIFTHHLKTLKDAMYKVFPVKEYLKHRPYQCIT